MIRAIRAVVFVLGLSGGGAATAAAPSPTALPVVAPAPAALPPPTATEISFAQALRTMTEQHVDVRVQKTKVAVANAQVMDARAAFSPTLNLQAQQQDSKGNVPSTNGVSPYNRARLYTANAAWNIFRSGADWAATRAANRDLSYQDALLDDTYLSAEERAARALFDLIEKRQALEAYRRSEISSNHFLEIARARFGKSLLSREEADKVAVDASNAEARRTDAELLYNSARAEVAALLGHADVQGSWPWENRLTLETAQTFLTAASGERAAESRPDVLAARFAIESQDERSRSSFRSMLPSVDLNYSVGDTHTGGRTISGWTTMATLTIPVWSGLRDYASYKIDVENKYAAEARLAQLRRDVAASVEAAQANFRLSVQLYQSRTRNLVVARHILGQDEARFKIGRADANELNLDLARVTEAEILAVQGIRQAHVAYVVLLHQFGHRVE